MNLNKQNLINKIIYRASYRGTKEMDILMIGFVRIPMNPTAMARGLTMIPTGINILFFYSTINIQLFQLYIQLYS